MFCKIESCNKEGKYYGFCWRHYEHTLKYGKAIKTMYDLNDFLIEGSDCFVFLCNRQREIIAKSIIDLKDYALIKNLKWGNKEGYCWNAKNKIALSRFLMFEGNIQESKKQKNILIDHINGNTLDNKRANLRFCSISENTKNRIGKRGKKYKGVCYYPYHGKKEWVSRIRVENKLIHLGYFTSEKEAVLIYNKAAKKYHRQFAKLNNIGD